MTKARDLGDLLDTSGDVIVGSLDNVSASNISSGTLNTARLPSTIDTTTVDLGNWTITESAGVLYFATGGTNKMKLDASGNFTVVGNVTAYGSV